jgi:hypothetical protein
VRVANEVTLSSGTHTSLTDTEAIRGKLSPPGPASE